MNSGVHKNFLVVLNLRLVGWVISSSDNNLAPVVDKAPVGRDEMTGVLAATY